MASQSYAACRGKCHLTTLVAADLPRPRSVEQRRQQQHASGTTRAAENTRAESLALRRFVVKAFNGNRRHDLAGQTATAVQRRSWSSAASVPLSTGTKRRTTLRRRSTDVAIGRRSSVLPRRRAHVLNKGRCRNLLAALSLVGHYRAWHHREFFRVLPVALLRFTDLQVTWLNYKFFGFEGSLEPVWCHICKGSPPIRFLCQVIHHFTLRSHTKHQEKYSQEC